MQDRPVSLSTIAAEAGVSTATVSLALRDHPRISAPVRARIHEIAARLGYRRNPFFAALGALAHRQAASRDGLPLMWVGHRAAVGAQAHGELRNGLVQSCDRLGYRFEEHIISDRREAQKLGKLIRARNIAGLFIGNIEDPSLLEELPVDRMALLGVGVYRELLPVHTVRGSRLRSAERTVRQVHALGYRRILVFLQWHRVPLAEDFDRFAGVQAAIRHIGLHGPSEWVRTVDFSYSDPRDETAQHWREAIARHRPDAVIGMQGSDRYNAGWSRDHSVRPPEPFAAMEVADSYKNRVTGMRQFNFQIGFAAAEWMDQMIRLGELGYPTVPRSQVVEPVWIEGETLGPKAATAVTA